MIVRSRLRAVLFPLVAYCIAGSAVSYFVWHARHGARGLETRAEYKAEMARLNDEYDGLEKERKLWEHRTVLMRAEAVDRDLLEEEAQTLLGRFDRRDVVIFTTSPVGGRR